MLKCTAKGYVGEKDLQNMTNLFGSAKPLIMAVHKAVNGILKEAKVSKEVIEAVERDLSVQDLDNLPKYVAMLQELAPFLQQNPASVFSAKIYEQAFGFRTERSRNEFWGKVQDNIEANKDDPLYNFNKWKLCYVRAKNSGKSDEEKVRNFFSCLCDDDSARDTAATLQWSAIEAEYNPEGFQMLFQAMAEQEQYSEILKSFLLHLKQQMCARKNNLDLTGHENAYHIISDLIQCLLSLITNLPAEEQETARLGVRELLGQHIPLMIMQEEHLKADFRTLLRTKALSAADIFTKPVFQDCFNDPDEEMEGSGDVSLHCKSTP
jgi:hypothetical protein